MDKADTLFRKLIGTRDAHVRYRDIRAYVPIFAVSAFSCTRKLFFISAKTQRNLIRREKL